MNQFFAAGAALVLAFTLWGFGKKPKNLFRTRDPEGLALSQVSLVEPSLTAVKNQSRSKQLELNDYLPNKSQQRILLLKQLKKLISCGPDERLLAVQLASEWGHPSVIPILKRGLRDIDSRVVIKSAEGIAKFRGSSKTVLQKPLKSYPLNISRMR
ncbi:HEAT repeat domain-containing protein [Prochlorococcus marinus]|uniref:HEAT repeat domain-containing protein n=1 Tax=Prochlorococcus marinus TaxID=1219 RepID=UPI0022B4E2CA|nr:HEAT repeat domain-containing protein [Prochlorococcus marinus]